MSDIIRMPCGSVNVFLIKEEEHAVLVDTGLAGYAEKSMMFVKIAMLNVLY